MRKRYLHIFLLALIWLLVSCDESNGVFTDDTSEEYQLYDYYIDSYGNEGIVAYIYDYNPVSKDEGKYIIVISVDETIQPWGPMEEMVFKDSITNSGINKPAFGVAMHQAMKSAGIERYPAQAWCDEKNNNEPYPRAGSWRLPTKNEFSNIIGTSGQKVAALNSALLSVGGTLLAQDAFYWTCVEDIDGYLSIKDVESDYDQANRAVMLQLDNTYNRYKDLWLKKNKHHVRAIKYVYYRN